MLQDVFRAYQERTIPASIGDSVASQVMNKLGLNLNMGINYFTNFLTGIPELKFFWEISGNLAEYAEDLHKLGFMFDPETKHYIYKSFSAVESPLRNLMDKLGGQDYIDIAKQVEENEKAGIEAPFPISRLTDRVEGGRAPHWRIRHRQRQKTNGKCSWPAES